VGDKDTKGGSHRGLSSREATLAAEVEVTDVFRDIVVGVNDGGAMSVSATKGQYHIGISIGSPW
jgi:hypothetical protein